MKKYVDKMHMCLLSLFTLLLIMFLFYHTSQR